MPRNPDAKFYKNILRAARKKARQDNGYDSDKTRTDLSDAFSKACAGKRPYPWQLDATEALILGIDCLVIAGTGYGKTLPMVMALLLPENKGKFVLEISPLKELQRDQADRCNEMDLPATPVNGENWSKELHKAIVKQDYRVLLTVEDLHHVHSRVLVPLG